LSEAVAESAQALVALLRGPDLHDIPRHDAFAEE